MSAGISIAGRKVSSANNNAVFYQTPRTALVRLLEKEDFGGVVFQPLVWEQLKAIGVTLVLAIVGTTVIAFLVKAVIGLRPSEEVETAGLDLNEHGEEGYHAATSQL